MTVKLSDYEKMKMEIAARQTTVHAFLQETYREVKGYVCPGHVITHNVNAFNGRCAVPYFVSEFFRKAEKALEPTPPRKRTLEHQHERRIG